MPFVAEEVLGFGKKKKKKIFFILQFCSASPIFHVMPSGPGPLFHYNAKTMDAGKQLERKR